MQNQNNSAKRSPWARKRANEQTNTQANYPGSMATVIFIKTPNHGRKFASGDKNYIFPPYICQTKPISGRPSSRWFAESVNISKETDILSTAMLMKSPFSFTASKASRFYVVQYRTYRWR